ncbi:hypothetical protein JXB02_05505 [Candidatus Woesearchaeota archaeon]|nr:hypothetical protein [Candidatus Woesearchaeota archaeon]
MQTRTFWDAFSRTEILHLLRAWAAVTFAFAIVISPSLASRSFLFYLLVSAVTVGLGFVVHEVAHKVVAQRFGCWAEFRADNRMLILAIIISFMGVLFAAPGAVMIRGRIDRRINGMISSSGPVANLALALLFMMALFSPFGTGPIVGIISMMGMMINGWLALFNLIPFFGFDGSKILAWNKAFYATLAIISLGIVFVVITA